MIWIETRKRLPPQGKKILWFKEGDCHVVQRLGKHWFPIPFCDSRLADLKAPTLWADIILPFPCTGKIMVSVGHEEMLDIDMLQKKHNDVYRDFINTMLSKFRKDRWESRKREKKFIPLNHPVIFE